VSALAAGSPASRVLARFISDVLAAGYLISVREEGEPPWRSRSPIVIFNEVGQAGERDALELWTTEHRPLGAVRFDWTRGAACLVDHDATPLLYELTRPARRFAHQLWTMEGAT
jgi:hypothetical protein